MTWDDNPSEEMTEKNGITVTRSKYSDAIFCKKNEIKVLKKLNTELGPDSISAYAFAKVARSIEWQCRVASTKCTTAH